jgi:hypothetical protein
MIQRAIFEDQLSKKLAIQSGKSASDALENWEHLEELRQHCPNSKIGKKKENFYKQKMSLWKD